MPTTLYLVRHGACDGLGRQLNGRASGIRLTREGAAQADSLGAALATLPIAAIYSSPLERARETAERIAVRLVKPVVVESDLDEIDFGDWTGASFEQLDADTAWRRFNSFRCGTPAPSGEAMISVQARMVNAMIRLRCGHPDDSIVVVSHGDPIKAVFAHYLGMPLDLLPRLEVSPGSISALVLAPDFARLLALNIEPHRFPPDGMPPGVPPGTAIVQG